MNWAQKTIRGIFASGALLVSTFSSAVPLSVFEQAGNDPARQAQIFRSDYGAAVAGTLTALRDRHFKDGKEKTPQRIERDKERADRIEQIAPHLTTNQVKALISMIAEYAAAQPNTELGDVIASFLLTETKTPLDKEFQQYQESHERYEATYRAFMENMEAWKRATGKAQAELDKEQADIDRRHRELNGSNSR